jgi:ribonuclease HII
VRDTTFSALTLESSVIRSSAVYPHYGFRSHVGYITPEHSAVVRLRGPSDVHRLSFQALCYEGAREHAAARG